jgi:hypothetical protein
MNMTQTYNMLFLILLSPLAIYAAYAYWKIFTVYNLLGSRAEKFGFLWFSFQFQLPTFSKSMPGRLNYFDDLPNNLKVQVLAVQRRLNSARLIVVLWIIFVILASVANAWFRRHYK